MAKMRVYEIAKSLNMKSGELVKILNENDFAVRSPQSNIEDAAIAFVLKNVKPVTVHSEKELPEELEKDILRKNEIKKEPEKKEIEKEEVEKTIVQNENNKKEEIKVTEGRKSEVIETTAQKTEVKAQKTEVKAQKTEVKAQEIEVKNTKSGMTERIVKNTGKAEETIKKEGKRETDSRNKKPINGRENQGKPAEKVFHKPAVKSEQKGNTLNKEENASHTYKSHKETTEVKRTFTNNKPVDTKRVSSNNQHTNRTNFANANKESTSNQVSQSKDAIGNNKKQILEKSSVEKTESLKTIGKNNQRGNGFKNKNKNKNKDRENSRNNETPKKDPNRKGAFIMPKPVIVKDELEGGSRSIFLPETLTIKELADKLKTPAAGIVKKLFLQGKMVSINQEISFEEAQEIALEFDCIAELEEKVDVIEELLKEDEEDESKLKRRPPVVCVMGHVDHGKTSLLDAIRETKVTEREAGGITQHIGAYVVNMNGENITFLDTPGHEAFTSMRMRGAKSTDIAILVVAADDGVMPQTIEAISHAKAAGVEIIVAINKIDKPSANVERVKQELVEYSLVAEDWGGDTIFVPVSAHTKEGIDQLLEMISLTAEMHELKANPNRKARGIVIEAQLDKGRGPVATILVQKGTLYIGDSIVIGSSYGKVRAMMDDKGRRVKEALPSTPVEILGLNEVPNAGEVFMATDSDKEARSIAEAYIKQGREKLLDDTKAKLSLDGLFSQIQAGNVKELNLIVKADVQGSVEAVKQSLLKLSNEEVAIRIIHGGVGSINESDVSLASASNAIIIGFNVRPDNMAKDISEREKVDVRLYRVIYNAIEDIEAAMKGMRDPVFEEKVIGHGEVRQVFKASGLGTIAGSYVLDGKITRGSSVRITREGKLIYEGNLASLKRFRDDVKEVAAGYECGLVFEKFNDINELDQVEVYIMEEVPR